MYVSFLRVREKCGKKSRKKHFDSPVVMHEVSVSFWGYGYRTPYMFSGLRSCYGGHVVAHVGAPGMTWDRCGPRPKGKAELPIFRESPDQGRGSSRGCSSSIWSFFARIVDLSAMPPKLSVMGIENFPTDPLRKCFSRNASSPTTCRRDNQIMLNRDAVLKRTSSIDKFFPDPEKKDDEPAKTLLEESPKKEASKVKKKK